MRGYTSTGAEVGKCFSRIVEYALFDTTDKFKTNSNLQTVHRNGTRIVR